MLYSKLFGLNWLISSGEEFFKNIFRLCNFTNCDYLPLKKDMAFPLNKLESPSGKYALLASLVGIGQLLLDKMVFF